MNKETSIESDLEDPILRNYSIKEGVSRSFLLISQMLVIRRKILIVRSKLKRAYVD